MNDENRFCVVCGAKLPEDSMFCPDCGTSVNGDAPARDASPRNAAGPAKGGNAIVPIFILVYGAIGLIIGLYELAGAIVIDEAAYQAIIDNFNKTMADYGLDPVQILPDWTDTTKLLMITAAVFGTLSPLAALGSYYFCHKTGPKKKAVQLCIAATVLILGLCAFSVYSVFAVPCFIVGAILTYLLYDSSDIFAA